MFDPVSLGMAFANTKGGASLLGGLGSSIGGALGAPDGPTSATSGAYGSGLDTSGFSVNFAGVQSAGSSQDKSGGVPGLGLSGVGSSIPWWVWLAAAGAVAWKLKAKK